MSKSRLIRSEFDQAVQAAQSAFDTRDYALCVVLGERASRHAPDAAWSAYLLDFTRTCGAMVGIDRATVNAVIAGRASLIEQSPTRRLP